MQKAALAKRPKSLITLHSTNFFRPLPVNPL